MKDKNSRCLVLNSDYTPLTIVDWKRALVWSMCNEHNILGVDVIDFYKNDYINGVNKKYPIPSVVKTRKYYRLNNQRVNFSRKNLFIRDDHTCQYCGIRFDMNQLTYDHVIPKSLWNSKFGTPTTWTNIVTSCVPCNRKKGNKTPKQAKMTLKNLPIIPNKTQKYLPVATLLSKIDLEIPQEWFLYLPGSYH